MYETHAMVQYQLLGVEPPELSVVCQDVFVLSYPTYHPSAEFQQLLNYVVPGLSVRALDGHSILYGA